eukprot:scaffold13663_cov120-Isochrysis_galbana.AAC.1
MYVCGSEELCKWQRAPVIRPRHAHMRSEAVPCVVDVWSSCCLLAAVCRVLILKSLVSCGNGVRLVYTCFVAVVMQLKTQAPVPVPLPSVVSRARACSREE